MPLPLVDPGAVWLVTEGHVDIVALTISREGGAADLQRTHLLRIPKGQFLFGLHAQPGAVDAQGGLLGDGGLIHVAVAREDLRRDARATAGDGGSRPGSLALCASALGPG